MKVRDIMTKPPQTCRLETPLGVASRRMKDYGCGTLVVLDHRGRVAGVLTDRDVALAMATGTGNPTGRFASEVMTRRVVTCAPGEDVKRALARMTEFRVRRLPVVEDDGDLQGMLSVDDIVLWAVQGGGVTRKALVTALRAICGAHVAPPEIEAVGETVLL